MRADDDIESFTTDSTGDDWIVPGGALVSLTSNKALVLLGVSSPESAGELLAELRTGTSIFDDPDAMP